jgi:hypothetical protein
MMPIFEDLLRVQAIEMNDEIRKSAFSFHVIDNKIKIFPIPTENFQLWFDYYLHSEKTASIPAKGSGLTVISDFSNVPYNNMKYSLINDVGKQWIRKYGLALTKELLGSIRSKYATIPIPNSDLTMDGETLRSEAMTEKEMLVTSLREMLEQSTRRAQLEKDRDESEFLEGKLQRVPIPIYIG